jgi:predicted nucleic acid-binding protein
MSPDQAPSLLDAGLLIGAIARADTRFAEAYPIVVAAQRGDLAGCTTVGILSEVYAALTWAGAKPPPSHFDAAEAVTRLIEPPSAIVVLSDGLDAALQHLEIARTNGLTARRIHDARHAATALKNGIFNVLTYDPDDWLDFASEGIVIAGPPSTLVRLRP